MLIQFEIFHCCFLYAIIFYLSFLIIYIYYLYLVYLNIKKSLFAYIINNISIKNLSVLVQFQFIVSPRRLIFNNILMKLLILLRLLQTFPHYILDYLYLYLFYKKLLRLVQFIVPRYGSYLILIKSKLGEERPAPHIS